MQKEGATCSSAHIYPQNNLMLSAAYDTSRERPKQFALDLCVYPLQLPAICRYSCEFLSGWGFY